MRWFRGTRASLIMVAWLTAAPAGAQVGYYRQPGLHENALVFVAEGDVWKVGLDGGVAAVAFLKRKIEQEPVGVPPVPAHPDKSPRK